ncbi:calpastatin [Sphingomonas sp. Leaf412]|uniref:DUF1810 domain-containing protein n=1 Tax=Sphingomonas sp. Leaf412 TaxID=1736370 RepID=UPI0006F4DE80|nr:DUF1810 family protein [Sphingomonas sp. Leaf412]KQT35079.1 calpastatin [Sphingomonas sp. Leaf412]
MTDDLDRFVRALADGYDIAIAELRAGRKRSHWMWFVFPQLAGLGRSPIARHYAIRDLHEARRYLAHPLLGPRYAEAVAAVPPDRDPATVFGALDAMKLRSSLTLFAQAGAPATVAATLAALFDGPDAVTVRLLDA